METGTTVAPEASMGAEASGAVAASDQDLIRRADQARARIASWTLNFPILGTLLLLAGVAWDGYNNRAPNVLDVFAALFELWGFYVPYILAIFAFLHAARAVNPNAGIQPNGKQMALLGHRFTLKVIFLLYSVPIVIFLVSPSYSVAVKLLGIYLGVIHSVAAAALGYFFGQPDPAPKALKE